MPFWSKAKLKLQERRLKKVKIAEKANQSELERLKEKATGSKILGAPDKRFLYGKIAGVALAALLTAGITEKGLMQYNRLMVEREKATRVELLSDYARQKEARMVVLHKAGVKNAEFWQEMMARNQYWNEKFPSVPKFSPEDYVELEKWLGDNHYAISTLQPIFKHAKTFLDNPTEKDLARERELFKEKFDSHREDAHAENPWDWNLIDSSFSNAEDALKYLIKNNGNPKFRKLLGKMREYSMFGLSSPFDPDYDRDAEPKLFKKIYFGEQPGKKSKLQVDQQLIDQLQLELNTYKSKAERLKWRGAGH
jgi:hypothetical protein